MENNLLNTSQQTDVNVKDSEFAEMVLKKALRDFRKEQILKGIDQSLLERNKEKFLQLTNELKNLT